jgi:hypothetical protein
MAIKTYRPTTQTLRYRTTLSSADLTTDRPHKPLTEPKHRQGGRRNSGDTTMRFRGGGHKRKLRLIDFKRDKTGIPATVVSIEYDPNRSARIALLAYADGEKRYILQPDGLKAGANIVSGPESREGRADGALGRRSGPASRKRRRLCAGEIALRRNSQGFAGLHGDDWAGRQHRPRKHHYRQSGTVAMVGQASAQSRGFDEPGRPSAWRWRRQNLRRPASGHALGTAHPRIQDAQQQADGQVHCE